VGVEVAISVGARSGAVDGGWRAQEATKSTIKTAPTAKTLLQSTLLMFIKYSPVG
jgi:hypothetical protein